MLITVNTHTFWTEAAPAASVEPYRQTLDGGRRSGDDQALARRCLR